MDMISRLAAFVLAALLCLLPPLPGKADAPWVVVSIKPVHSLVAAVMDGVATPYLILKGGASPHSYSLRPSDARALEKAQLVFWVGEDLERFLEQAIHSLAKNAEKVWMIDAPGLIRLEVREGGPFARHEDKTPSAATDGHEAHDHGAIDMHLWLDPANAKAMVSQIAGALSEVDPANASQYTSNAKNILNKLDALQSEIEVALKPYKSGKFIIFHDAYQYFENRFGLNATGSVSISPEKLPGAKRISQIRSMAREFEAGCIFTEPQFEPKLVRAITEGTGVRTGMLDPLGARLEDGPELYFELMRNMARSFFNCLSSR